MAIVDLVVKWTSLITFNNSNTQCVKAVLDLYSVIIDVTQDTTGQLHDVEAAIMIAVLNDKTGINNKPIKESSKSLLLRVEEVWPIK